ncbi:transforming growth factor-beta receptor-associated protein 1 isoform X1 [Mucor ambiguus]|uniref:Transforming growth factor-beta receptor-associated protein 1 isoform X1 n=1 Tax=Mucor ambiguus TaxID=91626 RepID=A0A0C9M6L2_9FUNG|nr:transforming growth factor-beta receptor-associated protein 1 isoform X1 [Mucor ambiguus]
MPYTPYTLQTILSSSRIEDHAPSTSSSTSFFSRRPTSPTSQETLNTTTASTTSTATVRYASNSKTRIDSVGAWDSDLYCGTSEGVVLHYSLEDNSSPDKSFSTRLKNTIHLGLGKKSVERILLIPQVSKAVVLCDSTLSFFSLPFFDPIPASFIQPIKGVSCFSHDIGEEGRIGEDGTVELAVIKRRAIQIYKIGESMHLKKELPLTDGAIALTRHSRILCLADAQNYKLINLQQSSVTLLIPTPQVPVTSPTLLGSGTQLVPRPLVAVVRKDEFLVVSGSSSDNQTIGIFVNANGDAIRGTLQWTNYPKALCVEFPYVAALLRNNTIEIHNILDQNLLQTIPLEASIDAKGMTFGHGIKVWMDVIAKRLKRHIWPRPTHHDVDLENQLQREIIRYSTAAARILVFGKDSVMAQVTTPLVVQVDLLLEKHLVEEAMQLAEQARNTISSDNNVYVERLRSELNYTYQKSGLLLLKETVFDDAFTLLSKGDMDPRVVINMFEGLAQSKWLKESPSVLLFDGVITLVEALGTIKNVANNSLKEFAKDSDQDSEGASEMRRVLLMNAREALNKYLRIEREKRKDRLGQNDTICKVIDTSLLKIYMSQKDDASIYQLLQQPNDCSIEDCAKTLSKSKKYYALSIMYESKHMYEKVLDIWAKIYSGELADPEFKNGLERIKNLLLQDVHTEELPLSVIMHYAWWLTHQSPEDGVLVFTQSPRTGDMDPDEILEKLSEYSNEGVRTYLEYLVLTQKSERAEYHTRLACSYVKDVHKEINEGNQLKQMKALVEGFIKQTDPMKIIPIKDDEEGFNNGATFVGYLGREQQQTHLVKLRLKLIQLLQSSQLYSPQVLLDVLTKAGPLDIEKVIVYGRMSKHKEALDILIHQLCDFVGAETYCVTNGQSTGVIPTAALSLVAEKPLPPLILEDEYLSPESLIERRSLFTMLFKSYIAIQDSKLMIARSMHLLNTQGFYLDTLEVLEMIPKDWSIDMLQEFLIRSLRRSLDDYNESQIVLGLSRGENLLISSDLIRTYKEIGPISVDNHTACIKCHRNVCDSIFVRESQNGQLLHLHCAKLLGLIDERATAADEEYNASYTN